ncbi:MAG: hypothetical protein K0R38_5442 [Polyangiaceae bacterium]|nr:hypothetical protein [Polyangiaceae bacterium]
MKLTYAAAGRDTLAAIDEELAQPARPAEAPLIEISETPAGRETMAAITQELAEAARPRQNTLPYGDRISNAPGARSPSRAPTPPSHAPTPPSHAPTPPSHAPTPPSHAPTPPSHAPSAAKPRAPRRATNGAPEVTLSPSRPPATPAPRAAPDALEIFELLTFIVRGNQVGELSTDAQRRRFAETHLLGRVPGGQMASVERVEVTPWTAKGTMVVRLWCRT